MSETSSDTGSEHDAIGPYFDRELDDAAARAFEEHLVGCARCQAELDDLMGLAAAMREGGPAKRERPVSEMTPVATVTPIRRRRWVAPAVFLAAVAAAVLVMVLVGRGGKLDGDAVVALADKRAVEVRFGAPAFDRHRPYSVARGSSPAESIPMATLAALERAGDHAGLLASHALARELDRAEAMGSKLGDTADAAADRAALALLRGRPEEALVQTEAALRRDPRHARALWNRALALRDLELPLAAAAAFDAVAARGEPGWAEEATERAKALRARITQRDRDRADLDQRGQALVAGHAVAGLTGADVLRAPGFTRIYFLDALRTAGDADAIRALAPVAESLDAIADESSARAAVDAALAADLAVRRRFNDRYRALIAGTLSTAEADALIAELAAAGPAVADQYVGALVVRVTAGGERARLPALERALGPTPSPWFALVVARARIAAHRDEGRDIEPGLTAALASCTSPAWSYRCGGLELDLAVHLGQAGRIADAQRHAARSRAAYAVAGAPVQEDEALAFEGELARHGGRDALAAAIFDEVSRRAAGSNCELQRYGQVGLANLALVRGDLDAVRVTLPLPATCPAPADGQAIMTAVDLARQTGREDDRARASGWLAAAANDPAVAALAAVGRPRLTIDGDPVAGRIALGVALEGLPADDPAAAGLRAWAYSALIADGAARDAWADVLADAGAELGAALPARCALVASVDDDRLVVAIRDAAGSATGSRRRVPVPEQAHADVVPDDLEAALATCPEIAVVARPPLEGRPDLLAVDRPWYFAGGKPRAAVAPPSTKDVLVVTDPATSGPRLTPATVPGARVLTGADATPSRVLAALASATYAELHVHGVVDLDVADASHLRLAPDPDGNGILTALAVRSTTLRGAPVVVLAACQASDTAPHLQVRWSLPTAFVLAGARAVIAADVDLPDDEAAGFFATVRSRIAAGEPPAAAVAATRTEVSGGRRDHWAAHVMVFQPL